LNKAILLPKLVFNKNYAELSLSLDIKWISTLESFGYTAEVIPLGIMAIEEYIKERYSKGQLDTIILTGGGDPKFKDIRYDAEKKIIEFAINQNIKLIGICRGMQAIGLYFGGTLQKIDNHVASDHQIQLCDEMTCKVGTDVILVNSYHDYVLCEKSIECSFDILGREISDSAVELIQHKVYRNIVGMMCHPERGSLMTKALFEVLIDGK